MNGTVSLKKKVIFYHVEQCRNVKNVSTCKNKVLKRVSEEEIVL